MIGTPDAAGNLADRTIRAGTCSLRRSGRAIIAAGMALALTGCAFAPGFYLGETTAESEEAAAAIEPVAINWDLIREFDALARPAAPEVPQQKPGPYRIGPGDALRITVWNHPDLNYAPNLSVTTRTAGDGSMGQASNVVPLRVVNHDGAIYFPMAGRVEAAGRTAPELRDQIARQLSRFVKEPQIEVDIAAFRSQRVFVVGEVKVPGNLPVTDVPMYITDALGQAGGATTDADLSSVTVTRGERHLALDLDRLYYDGEMSQNLLLQNGDVVTVPDRRERKIFVLGEVLKPQSYILPRGRTTLAEAVADAGGPNPLTSQTGQIYVLRLGTHDQPFVYQLDARSPQALLLADRFSMQARDVVYIDPTQLARAGRVIAQLLPWAQGAYTTVRATD